MNLVSATLCKVLGLCGVFPALLLLSHVHFHQIFLDFVFLVLFLKILEVIV